MRNITSKLKLNKRFLILTTVVVTSLSIASAQNGQKYSSGGNQLNNGDVLGSTNNQPVIFISNDEEVFRIKSNGSAVFKNDIKLKGGLQITDFAGNGFRLLKVEDDGSLSVLTATNDQSDVLTGAGIFTPFASMFQKQWDERFNGSSNNFLAQDGHFYPMSSLSQFSWNLKGNEGVDPNKFFLGNKDAIDLSIRTNNHERLRILSTGELQIAAPDNTNTFALDVAGNAHIGGWLYVDNGVVISQKIEGDEIKTRNLELLATSEILGKAHFVNDAEIMERVSIGDNLFNIDPKYRLSINGATEVKGELTSNAIYTGNVNASSINVSENITADKLIINKLITQNEIEFGNGGTIYHSPETGSETKKYGIGMPPITLGTSALCSTGAIATQELQFPGLFESYSADNSKIMLMGFDGAHGIIDVRDVNSTSEPGLLINWNCGANTTIGSPTEGDLTINNNLTVKDKVGLGVPIINLEDRLEVSGTTKFYNYDYANNTGKFVSITHDGSHGRIESTEDLYINYYKNTNVQIGAKISTTSTGASLTVTKDLNVDGESNLVGDVTLNNNLTVSGTSNLNNIYATGISTLTNLKVNGYLEIPSQSTDVNQVLKYDLTSGKAVWGTVKESQWEPLGTGINYTGKVGINTTKNLGALSINNAIGKENGITVSGGNVTTSIYNLGADSYEGAIQVKSDSWDNELPSLGVEGHTLALQPEGGSVRIGKHDEVSGNESNLFVDGKIESKEIFTNDLNVSNLVSTYSLNLNSTFGDIYSNGSFRPHFAAGKDFTIWEGVPPNTSGNTPRFIIAGSSGNTFLAPNGGVVKIGKHDGRNGDESNLYVDGTIVTDILKAEELGTVGYIALTHVNDQSRIISTRGLEIELDADDNNTDESFLITSNAHVYGNGNSNENYQVLFKVNGAGTAYAREVIVNNDWGDYVFAPDYSLMGLRELENYFTKNHHLPEIPSADEIKESGIPIGEMQKLQMVKIEELTLYLVAQDKRIKDLEDRNNKMQEQILLFNKK